MDARKLRSSLKSSSINEFIALSTKIDLRTAKPTLKALLWGLSSSSNLSSALPASLHAAIIQSVNSFRKSIEEKDKKSPSPPPSKRLRRSSRGKKSDDGVSGACLKDRLNSMGRNVLKHIHIYTFITRCCISHPSKLFSPSDLLPSVQSLHEHLVLYDSDPALMSAIAGLCEDWWKDGLVGKETLVSQSLPFLIAKSLQSGKRVDLHRVYALREALCLFDFNDDSIDDLKHLLIRCAITSLYLKVEEGRRFIAFLFGLSNQLLKETLAVIRAQIPFGRKSILEAFGDILFRAWKGSEASVQREIENGILQSLVEGAIYAKSPQLAASIRRVLGGFISQRTAEGVEKLLFHLVEPVLFRSLQVANSNVRQNALHVLLDMFPLENPDATKEARDTMQEKQFFLLDKLLADKCPAIRVTAVEGSCRILCLFWEVISPTTITKILGKIIDELSHDICSEVRISTVSGIIYLLENPQAHEILKVLLPRLRHLFLDTVVSVRMASVDLLLALRDLRNFQFTEVVCSNMLLSSLANDCAFIARRITKLLLPSYFPSKMSSKEACTRCVALIRRLPLAGARFCEFAFSEGSSVKSLIGLVSVFTELALSVNEAKLDEKDGFFLAASNLCQSLANEISAKPALDEFFSGKKLKDLFNAAFTSSARTSVLRICSVVSPLNVVELIDEIMAITTDCAGLYANAGEQEAVRTAHTVIFLCGKCDNLIEALTKLLQVAASRYVAKAGPAATKLSLKKKKVKLSVKKSALEDVPTGKKLTYSEEDYVVALGVAWQIKEMLAAVEARAAILDSHFFDLILSTLRALSGVNIEKGISDESLDMSPILAYTSLVMHMAVRDVVPACADQNDSGLPSTVLLQETIVDDAVEHLISCAEKLFPHSLGSSSQSSSKCKQRHEMVLDSQREKRREVVADVLNTSINASEKGSCFPGEIRMLNSIKIATTILKFIIDAACPNFIFHKQDSALQFTLTYFQYVVTVLGRHEHHIFLFGEAHFSEIFTCIRSSVTYAAKLLNISLTNIDPSSGPPSQAFNLASMTLNLIVAAQLHLDSKHVMHMVATVKPWLPDLILGLGCNQVFGKGSPKALSILGIHSWIADLGKAELKELEDTMHDRMDDEDTRGKVAKQENQICRGAGALKKLIEMALELLRNGDQRIMEAVGVLILKSAKARLIKDIGMVLGLVHFVCAKMMGLEAGNWEAMGMILTSLKEIYFQINNHLDDPSVGKDKKHKLQRVKALIECTGMVHESCNDERGTNVEQVQMSVTD